MPRNPLLGLAVHPQPTGAETVTLPLEAPLTAVALAAESWKLHDATTENGTAFDVPLLVSETLTLMVCADARFAVGISAVSWVALTSVVVRLVVPHRTC